MKEYYGQPTPNGCSTILLSIVIFAGFGFLWLMSPVFTAIAKYQVEIGVVVVILIIGLLFFLNTIDSKRKKANTDFKSSPTRIKDNNAGKREIEQGLSDNPFNLVQESIATTITDNKLETNITIAKRQNHHQYDQNQLPTIVSDQEWEKSTIDEYGARYDRNNTRLIQGPSSPIKSYKVKSGTKVICDKAFSDLFEVNNLEEVYLPETIVKIGFASFYNCKKLKTVNLPSSLIEIGKDSFRNCVSIEKVILPPYLDHLDGGAFSGCVCSFESKSSKFVVKVNLLLSSDLKYLYHCRANAQYVIIPNTVEKIGECAFSDCKHLVGVEIPSSVISIGDHAFENCTSLNKVLFHENLQKIGFGAFAGCKSLIQIFLPYTTSFIDDLAFSQCTNLSTVFFPHKFVRLGQNVFDGQQSLPCIFVPHTCYTKYKDQLSGYNNGIFKDNSCFSLSAFESFFGASCIVWKHSSYALLFETSIIVLFDKESSEYLQANKTNSNVFNVNTGLIRIIVDREYITGFKAYFTQLCG